MSPRQKAVLEFINIWIQVYGYSPSQTEIALGMKLRSRSNIHRIVHVLRGLGLLHVKPNVNRSVKVVDKTVEKILSL